MFTPVGENLTTSSVALLKKKTKTKLVVALLKIMCDYENFEHI